MCMYVLPQNFDNDAFAPTSGGKTHYRDTRKHAAESHRSPEHSLSPTTHAHTLTHVRISVQYIIHGQVGSGVHISFVASRLPGNFVRDNIDNND